jgi:hypothetical protein
VRPRAGRRPALWLGDGKLVHQQVKSVAVLCQVHRFDAGAEYLTLQPAAFDLGFERLADVHGGLSAELYHHAVRAGRLYHVGDLLGRDRLEKEPV